MPLLDSTSSSFDEAADEFYFNAMMETGQIILKHEQNREVSSPRSKSAHLNRDREDDLACTEEFFTLRYDANGKWGFTTLKKCTAVIRQLAYATCSESWDEFLKTSERTSWESLYKYCKRIIKLYNTWNLRKPTMKDIEKIICKAQGKIWIPRILGSIDCTNWLWCNCLTAWWGQFTLGDHVYHSIMLEAMASQDLWVWHTFFCVVGSNNDQNVLHQSKIFNDICNNPH